MATSINALTSAKSFWTERFKNHANSESQQKHIESLMQAKLKPDDYYAYGMDFGCGHGRFMPFLSDYCGHIYAADIVPEAVWHSKNLVSTSSGIVLGWPYKINWPAPRLDLMWSFFTFQHIVDDSLFETCAAELLRCMKSDCRVMVIDNAVDVAKHVKPRQPERIARALGLKSYTIDRLSLSKPSDHWFLDGVRT